MTNTDKKLNHKATLMTNSEVAEVFASIADEVNNHQDPFDTHKTDHDGQIIIHTGIYRWSDSTYHREPEHREPEPEYDFDAAGIAHYGKDEWKRMEQERADSESESEV